MINMQNLELKNTYVNWNPKKKNYNFFLDFLLCLCRKIFLCQISKFYFNRKCKMIFNYTFLFH